METRDPPELGPALLRWVNSFGLAESIESWRPLQDGNILWKILQDIEPRFFSGSLPEDVSSSSSSWIPKWQNLKYINRQVLSFIRDECGKLQELSKRMNPDLKAMAIDASPNDSLQLVKAIFLAAMYSPESNHRMILVIDKLGTKIGIALASSISQMEQLDQKLVEAAPPSYADSDFDRMSSPEPETRMQATSRGRDPELEREEKLIQAYAHVQELEVRIVSLTKELEESREEVANLHEDLGEVRQRLEQGHAGPDDDGALELLRQRADNDKESIAQLEAELADARSTLESQDKQLERLHTESESYQKLRDEVQMLKIERDELQQKSKANENLKKKIQTLQDSDKSNQKVREDLAAAEQELQSLRPLKTRLAALQKTNEEIRKLIQNGEQEIFDQKTTRKRLDHDLRMLKGQVESAKERHQRDQEMVKDLEEKIRELSSGPVENGLPVGSLNDEFLTREKVINDMKSKNAELEAEVAKFREAQNGDEAQLPAPADQSAYDLLKSRYDKLEKQYLDAYQENLGLESAARAAQDGLLESQPFVEMRERLKVESEQKAVSEKKLFDLEAELSEAQLRLRSADSKLAAVDKTRSDAIEELQQSASAENRILQTENSRLLQHIETHKGDLEEHRSLLRHALLDKAGLLKKEADQRFQDELKLVTEQIGAVVEQPDRMEDIALRLAQRLEAAWQQANDMEAQNAKQTQGHQDEMESLKNQYRKSEEANRKNAKKPFQEKLQRELDLMTSAWYDVTKRMQSDAVVMQRRTEVPRSFLNRQRRLVNNPSMARR